ncbi:Protein CBG19862 [Caenorhabditis briggsae]|uniref:Protein CBG19862 n=1 Tax=Caenorhabditis briggsae TaxID=6238 RepID=A8XWL9_CAEBR|nr:Protein CBG19862 [Caenorhabditis briggsae]CAP37038.1 Protein CBG19862 [Caenorhabditis briggsae]
MKGIEKKTRRMKSGKSLQTKGEEQIDGRSKGTSDEADRVQGTMELADLELDQGTHLLTPVLINSKLIYYEEFTVNDIAMMFKSLAEKILKLQSQNTMLKNQNCILNANLSNLTEKVDGLEENLKLLSSQPKESPKPPTTLIKTFASAVASTISAPESQITFMRAASLANSEDARKSNVIIKNIDLSEEAIEKAEFASKTAKDCGTSTPSEIRCHLLVTIVPDPDGSEEFHQGNSLRHPRSRLTPAEVEV